MYIQILNGPNLNKVGVREPSVYGTVSMDDIINGLTERYASVIQLRYSQYNGEGGIIDVLQACSDDPECRGVVLNAGAYSHTSLAVADAVRGMSIPVVEVHMSNVYSRDPIRSQAVVAPACKGMICGFGADSYRLAVEALMALKVNK